MNDMQIGDSVTLLTHDKKQAYKVLGVQFVFTDIANREGLLHVRLLTMAHGQKWFALVPVCDIEKIKGD